VEEKARAAVCTELFDSKIVIDAMNPYSENFEIIDLGNSTLLRHLIRYIMSISVQKVILMHQKKTVLQSVLQEMISMQGLLFQNILRI
jgi:hypothetical protein